MVVTSIQCWDSMQETPVEATHWGRWARQLPLPAEFTVLVAPPLVGGIVVGSLRALTQFDKPGVAAFSSRPVASNPLKVHPCADINLHIANNVSDIFALCTS